VWFGCGCKIPGSWLQLGSCSGLRADLGHRFGWPCAKRTHIAKHVHRGAKTSDPVSRQTFGRSKSSSIVVSRPESAGRGGYPAVAGVPRSVYRRVLPAVTASHRDAEIERGLRERAVTHHVTRKCCCAGGRPSALTTRLRVWISSRSRSESSSVCMRVCCGSRRWMRRCSPPWLSTWWQATSSARADTGTPRKSGYESFGGALEYRERSSLGPSRSATFTHLSLTTRRSIPHE